MGETSSGREISLTEYIQQEYLRALEKSSDLVGLNRHEVRFVGQSIDSKLIDHHVESMFMSGQGSMSMVFYHIISEGVDIADELAKYMVHIKKEISKYKLDNEREFIAMNDPNAPRINGSIILNRFYQSFNEGMCDIYDAKKSQLNIRT